MAKKKVNRYTEEFRRQAVSLADQPGKTAREVAGSLGIHVNQIYNWRTLKHENALLKQERDFLKKAAAYFANQKK